MTLWAVAAVIWHMAGGLVGEQVNVDVFLQQEFQQVNNVAVVSDRTRLFRSAAASCAQFSASSRLSVYLSTQPCCITGHDTGDINLSDNRSSTGNISSLALCAAHAAQTGGNEQLACEVAFLRNAQNLDGLR